MKPTFESYYDLCASKTPRQCAQMLIDWVERGQREDDPHVPWVGWRNLAAWTSCALEGKPKDAEVPFYFDTKYGSDIYFSMSERRVLPELQP